MNCWRSTAAINTAFTRTRAAAARPGASCWAAFAARARVVAMCRLVRSEGEKKGKRRRRIRGKETGGGGSKVGFQDAQPCRLCYFHSFASAQQHSPRRTRFTCAFVEVAAADTLLPSRARWARHALPGVQVRALHAVLARAAVVGAVGTRALAEASAAGPVLAASTVVGACHARPVRTATAT